MAIIKNPDKAAMRNITDISFEPFRRKQSDLNYYIAQSIRIYGKQMVYSDDPVSAYIRGFDVTDNVAHDGVIVKPGVVLVNNSYVILKEEVELDRPNVVTDTFLVIDYLYVDQWEVPVPEFKWTSSVIKYNKLLLLK